MATARLISRSQEAFIQECGETSQNASAERSFFERACFHSPAGFSVFTTWAKHILISDSHKMGKVFGAPTRKQAFAVGA
jgi:hypothetical protein